MKNETLEMLIESLDIEYKEYLRDSDDRCLKRMLALNELMTRSIGIILANRKEGNNGKSSK